MSVGREVWEGCMAWVERQHGSQPCAHSCHATRVERMVPHRSCLPCPFMPEAAATFSLPVLPAFLRRIIESLRLENITKIIWSNYWPITTMPITRGRLWSCCHSSPHASLRWRRAAECPAGHRWGLGMKRCRDIQASLGVPSHTMWHLVNVLGGLRAMFSI